MQKEIQNLFNKEEWIVLNIKNTAHQVKLYLAELHRLTEKYDLTAFADKAKWYQQVFEYYRDDLIPAIQEAAEMEMKHIAVFDKNPDTDFHSEIEIQIHQQLTKQFLSRFEQLHAEFHQFTLEVKK
ncbi:MAG: hypothetical protein ACI9XO_004389 [Paraglaciecola sp.]|jgi:hypothetical protein